MIILHEVLSRHVARYAKVLRALDDLHLTNDEDAGEREFNFHREQISSGQKWAAAHMKTMT